MIEDIEDQVTMIKREAGTPHLGSAQAAVALAKGASALDAKWFVPRKMTALERDQAKKRLTDVAIVHPAYETCLRAIASMHVARQNNGSAPRGMLITGLTGSGKSTIAKVYAQAYPRREEEERTVIPVLYVELSGQPTAKVIAECILSAMGDENAPRATAEQKLRRVLKLLVECRVELVIVDELNNMTDNLLPRVCDISADTFKNLMNQSGVPHLFISGPSCRPYFVRNQQLGRRCTPKVQLRPFGMATSEDKRAFQRLLKALELRLPFTERSALVDVTVTGSLWFASFGLFGLLTQLVGEALDLALQAEASTLTVAHLHEAFSTSIYEDCPSDRNPFDATFNGSPLIKPGEPFCGFEA